jgi:prepilin-type processing-associated H-X9-DG protein
MTRMMRCGSAAFLAVVVSWSVAAAGQPLADRVPADAVAYVGWRGADSLGPAYATSHLKGVIDASSLPQLAAEALPRLLKKLGEEDDDAAVVTELMVGAGGVIWRHPTAIYIGGVDAGNPDAPLPKLGLICDAGAEGPALAEQLKKAVAKIEHPPFPIRVEEEGGLVVLAVGKVDLSAKGKPAAALAGRREFVETMGKVDKDPVIAAYVDAEAIHAQVENVVSRFAPPDGQQKWAMVRNALGVSGVKRLAWTGAFDGGEWSTQALVSAPAPRMGLLKFVVEAPPLSEEALKSVPMTATFATAGHFDLGALLGTIREMAKKMNVDVTVELEGGLNEIKQSIGMDLQADILDTLGGEWTMYTDPAVGGTGILGLTVVNRLKDPAKAERAFSQLEQLLNGMMKEAAAGGPVTVAFNTTRQGDLTIHYLAIPFFAPSWAVKGDSLYVGLYPQVVSGAVEHAASGGKSILDKPEFAELRKRLGAGANVSSVSYTDLPTMTAEGYQEILMVVRAYQGMADLFGAHTPAMSLPTLAALMPHVRPTLSVGWADAEGWHSKSISPFPGSDLLAAGGMGSGLAAEQTVMLGTIMPSLARSRMVANRVKSASNLRQIGQAMLLYANENKGKYPADFGELLLTQDITAEVFTNPQTKTRVPRGKELKALSEWVKVNSDYEYLGAGKNNQAGPEVILAHEKMRPGDQGINMLYGDGHVEWNVLSVAQEQIAKQRAAEMKMMKKADEPEKGGL